MISLPYNLPADALYDCSPFFSHPLCKPQHRLFITITDRTGLRMSAVMHYESGLSQREPSKLTELPVELLERLGQYLSPKDLLQSVPAVHPYLNNVFNDKYWRWRVHRNFPEAPPDGKSYLTSKMFLRVLQSWIAIVRFTDATRSISRCTRTPSDLSGIRQFEKHPRDPHGSSTGRIWNGAIGNSLVTA